jgi:hypothetical protein
MPEILCPACPVCDSPPPFTGSLTPWFCPVDDCVVLAWNPHVTQDENLLDAQSA